MRTLERPRILEELPTFVHPSPDIEDILGIGNDFPHEVYVGRTPSNSYLIYCYGGMHGLACFSKPQNLTKFVDKFCPLIYCKPELVTFDDARDIAKSRPVENLVCLLLLDDINDPKIHYIK